MLFRPFLLAVVVTAASCDGCDAPSEGEGDDAAEGEGDDAAEGEGDDAAEGEGDDAAEGEGDGNPLDDSYDAFCAGAGTVVSVGNGVTDLCLGQVAAQTFQFGLCACTELIADGSQVLVDSFDSRDGPYGAGTAGNSGSVGVNGRANINVQMEVHGSMIIGGPGSVSVGDCGESTPDNCELHLPNGGNNTVTGDLYVNGDALADGRCPVGNDAYVTGSIDGFEVGRDLYTSRVDLVSADVTGTTYAITVPVVDPCPCSADQLLDITAIVGFGQTHNDNAVVPTPLAPDLYANAAVSGPPVLELPCGRFYLAGIEQSQGLTLHATGRTVLFVNGNFVANALQVQLDEGAEVDIFVTGDMSFGSSSNLGSIEHPSSVRTYVNGQLALGAQATFGGLIYAPHADVVFNASANIYGALFVDSAQFSGNTEIHFDTAVRAAGTCEPGEGEGEGETGCTACDIDNQCGDQACVVAPGATVGGCQACTSSLDCCFPQVCLDGGCFNIGD
jgi:hypothetical protein